jgi:uncharacterized protein YabN with tetrapyrrole methylase and pyrophosphatase domain
MLGTQTMANKTALNDLIATELAAREFGFDWPNAEMIIQQANSECVEITQALENNESPERVQEEIGDLLHTAISLCLFQGYDVDQTLTKTNAKFSKRMQTVMELAHRRGFNNLTGQPIEFLLELWQEAKTIAG